MYLPVEHKQFKGLRLHQTQIEYGAASNSGREAIHYRKQF
jgi:hypothetical protein